MAKTLEEINEKIRKGDVVVVTAEEMAEVVAEKGAKSGQSHRRGDDGDVRPHVLLRRDDEPRSLPAADEAGRWAGSVEPSSGLYGCSGGRRVCGRDGDPGRGPAERGLPG